MFCTGFRYAYSRRVLLGLILSGVGDTFLVWNETFYHGLLAFFFAQLFYISAFGFYPFNIYVCATVYGIMTAGTVLIIIFLSHIRWLWNSWVIYKLNDHFIQYSQFKTWFKFHVNVFDFTFYFIQTFYKSFFNCSSYIF